MARDREARVPERVDPADDADRDRLRRALRRRVRHGAGVHARRDGPLLRRRAHVRRPVPGDGVADGRGRHGDHLQPHRRPRVRLPRPADPL